jgi:hypothetical protein
VRRAVAVKFSIQYTSCEVLLNKVKILNAFLRNSICRLLQDGEGPIMPGFFRGIRPARQLRGLCSPFDGDNVGIESVNLPLCSKIDSLRSSQGKLDAPTILGNVDQSWTPWNQRKFGGQNRRARGPQRRTEYFDVYPDRNRVRTPGRGQATLDLQMKATAAE